MARTLVQRFVRDIRVVVRGAEPTEEDFDAHVEDAVRRAGSVRAVLVVLVGDGANMEFTSRERAKLFQAGLFATPCGVLAPSIRPERVTEETWVGVPMRTFGPDQFDELCDYLNIDARSRPALADEIASMKAQLAEGAADGTPSSRSPSTTASQRCLR